MKKGGTQKNAAALLGMNQRSLQSRIRKDPLLRSRWIKERSRYSKVRELPPHEESPDLGRTSPPINKIDGEVIAPDLGLAEAMAREDANLKYGLEAIGLSKDAQETAISLQKFHNKHFTKAIEIIGGGMTKTFVELMAEVEQINERLASGGLTLEEEQMLRQDRSRLLEAQGRTYDRAQKAAMTQAVIKHRLADAAGDKNAQRGKPGFQPIVNAIKIEADGDVKVSGQGNTD
tara:strand:+ start:3288 stop:3983 length:696 start_codon:yes stop_codon:yes gene_type:complete